MGQNELQEEGGLNAKVTVSNVQLYRHKNKSFLMYLNDVSNNSYLVAEVIL